MDLRNQEEQISRWLEAESENQEEELSDISASETEDILETEVHENTSSDSCSLQSSESDSDINVQPSKRQRTQIIDSDDSSSENITVPRPSISNQNTDPRIVQPTSRFVYGKNKHKWSTQPRPATTRTLRRNIVHFIPGPKAEARESVDPINLFSLFITDEMLQQIVTFTNAEILIRKNKYKNDSYTISQTDFEEMRALLGLLFISAAVKSNHLPTRMLFNTQRSGTIFKACMSAERFNFLIKCLRFDDKQTRDERKFVDKFTHIRELWQKLIDNFQKWYTPGSYITVDEQLVGFRGRCPFRMYIPNKPNKYGIKLVMAADVNSKYIINCIPYLGKGTDPQKQPLASFFIKEVTAPLHGSNRNITMDNWFTSVPLADELLVSPYNLTLVGTLRSNKREIPKNIKNSKSRSIGTSMFCYDGDKTLVSFKAKSNKMVFLLSTIHDQPTINETTGKPEIIHFYNGTKGAVDTVDQMCSNMSTNRKTMRWPMCIFYNMLNLAAINAYAIYVSNNVRNHKKPMSRRDFVMKLGDQLMEPWLRQRLQTVGLRRNIRVMIEDILGESFTVEAPLPSTSNARKICYLCPSKARRMTKHRCTRCGKAICGPHNVDMCSHCLD
ncbi:piggyBac transposable element-derived protein 4-like [Vanessa cardui]|uniref:piggyBac transposable element-derived protein 4-like n=1 Tax=Vanessa cardui TaxID=171605 RepID=UPI001F13B4E4|nr:piggyBac transposable element-derived protein 4-like [Vanessa cardui]XP_046975225.1 piggyBac transposable element-derived protein 4-like [Vanessa cardui]XP_046976590.1 piggyBac transposable element-derived protein 4-like [Vanessa cardui]